MPLQMLAKHTSNGNQQGREPQHLLLELAHPLPFRFSYTPLTFAVKRTIMRKQTKSRDFIEQEDMVLIY